ncbi:MAG: flagellar FlbD family protein [Candidatus Aminicenantes bacterium]|nr:MAG: flagellar FlbD family protein [Candidatus Aminicenantes bacterium]
MIRLIREDGIEILLNTAYIQQVGSDENRRAVITLTNGEVLKVKNPAYDVTQKTKAYLKGLKEERKEYERKRSEELNKKEKEDKKKKEK